MKAQVVSFHCELRNKLGHLISRSFYREVVNAAPPGAPLADLVEGLRGVAAGESRRIAISAERAYGFYDPALTSEMQRSELKRGSELGVGDEISLHPVEGGNPRSFRIVRQTPDTVFVDGNHPLAGQDLIFDIQVTEARELRRSDDVELPEPAPARPRPKAPVSRTRILPKSEARAGCH